MPDVTAKSANPAAENPPAAGEPQLANELFVPGRTLVFCDDTDIAGQPVEALKPDLRILVAVQMESDGYAALDAAITAALAENGVSEFHATDIATGNGEWRGRDKAERTAALAFLAEQLAEHARRVGGVWLPKGHYAGIRVEAEKRGKVGAGFKTGLKRVLVRSIVERLANGTRSASLWLDQDAPLAVPQVEHWPEAAFLIAGGPVVAPSHLVSGLQVADLATWSVQRFMTKRAGYDDGSANEFDDIAAAVLAVFPTGLDDLRGNAFAEDWAP